MTNTRFFYSDIVEWVMACFCITLSILIHSVTGKLNIFLIIFGIISLNKIAWHWRPYVLYSVLTRGMLFLCLLNASLVCDAEQFFYVYATFSAGAFFTLIHT